MNKILPWVCSSFISFLPYYNQADHLLLFIFASFVLNGLLIVGCYEPIICKIIEKYAFSRFRIVLVITLTGLLFCAGATLSFTILGPMILIGSFVYSFIVSFNISNNP